jgi:hypothetical protein
MVTSRATRIANVLFPITVVGFIVATAFGLSIHWSSWTMLGASGLMLAGSLVGPRRSDALMISSAALSVVSFIGAVASKFQ